MTQRYFFNLRFPSDYVVDSEGVEADDLEAAKRDAREIIREFAVDYANSGCSLTLRSIEICDSDKHVVANITTVEALDELVAPLVFSSKIRTHH